MHFDRIEGSPPTVNIRLEVDERKVLHKAIVKSILNAAREGGNQLPNNDTLLGLGRLLLDPKFLNSRDIHGLGKHHCEAMATSVSALETGVPYDEVKVVGGLAAELGAAARSLEDNKLSETIPTTEEIDEIVANFEIPDTPEGI